MDNRHFGLENNIAVTYASGNNEYTAYVRDAHGNVMAVYQLNSKAVDKGTLNLIEQHIYDSSRPGIYNRSLDADKDFVYKKGTAGRKDL